MPYLKVNGRQIFYGERPTSPDESYQAQQGQARRTFDVAWADRWEFCKGVLGWSEVITDPAAFPGATLGQIHRELPQAYEDLPQPQLDLNQRNKFWLYASQVERIEGVAPRQKNPKTDIGTYERARVTILYESVSFKMLSDDDMVAKFGSRDEANLGRFVTRFIQPSAEYLTLPFAALYWADGTNETYDAGPLPLPKAAAVTSTNAGLIIPSMEVVYIWHQVPNAHGRLRTDSGPPASSLPKAARTLLGAVNKDRFDFAEPGTLLLTSVEMRPYRLIGGGYVNDITYKMKYFNALDPAETPPKPYDPPRGHNFFLHYFNSAGDPLSAKAYKYDLITHNGYQPSAGNVLPPSANPAHRGLTVYRVMDFNLLFRPDLQGIV